VIDWPWVAFGWLSIGSLAIYLQYRANIAAMDRLSAEHYQHTTDLREAIAILQLDLMHARETMTHARPNRVTHADLAEGLIGE
jgi:type II secretory pathway component PulJ